MCSLPVLQQLGLTIIRIGLGVILTIFGCQKLMSGTTNLAQIGSAVGLFGITWGYLWWGYAAALTELCGGLAFAFGFHTRIVAIPIACLLIVALRFHLQNNDPFMKWACALLCLCVVAGIFIAGSGIYSLDHVIKICSSCKTTPAPKNNDSHHSL